MECRSSELATGVVSDPERARESRGDPVVRFTDGAMDIVRRYFLQHMASRSVAREIDLVTAVEGVAAVRQRAIDAGHRQQARPNHKFLLHVHEDDDRDIRRIGKRTKTYNRIHPPTPSAAARVCGRFPQKSP